LALPDVNRKSHGAFRLLVSRRFGPLFATQFLSAFNDNAVRNALVLIIAYRADAAGQLSAQIMIPLAAGLFMLPFFLCSATAGQIADAGNFSGDIAARSPAGNISGSGNIAEGRLNSGNVNAARNTVNYGNVNAYGNGGYGSGGYGSGGYGSGGYGSGYYGNGYYGNGSYWGAYAAGAATGTAVGAAAASDRSSTTYNYYTPPYYSYTCWDAQNQTYYSSTVPCSG
jgi:hypothetical protein